MNTKTTLVLALIAAVVAFYIFFLEKPWETRPEPEQPTTTAQNLFDPQPADVDRLELTLRGQHGVFEKGEDDQWFMREPIECRATNSDLNHLINTLSTAMFLKEYGPKDKDRPSLEVTRLDRPTVDAKLYARGKLLAEIKIGAPLPTGRGCYIEISGSANIYESQREMDTFATRTIEQYRDKRVFPTLVGNAESVTTEGVVHYTIVKNNEDWVIDSEPRGQADRTEVNSITSAVMNLYIQDWKDDSPESLQPYGLEPPRVKITVQTKRTVPAKARPGDPDTQPADTQPSEQEHNLTLLVGAPIDPTDPENTHYFAKIDTTPWVFTIRPDTYKTITKPLVDLRDKNLAGMVEPGKAMSVVVETAEHDVHLVKDGSLWRFKDTDEADQVAVSDLLRAIKNLKAVEFVTESELLIPANWERPRAKVSVTLQGELNPVVLLVGPPSPSGRMAYVRKANEPVIAAVREEDVAQFLASPATYRDRTVMMFPSARASNIEIVRANGPRLVLSKVDNQWHMVEPVEAKANTESVTNLLQDLALLRAEGILSGTDEWAKAGLDQPAVTVSVTVQPAKVEPEPADTQPATPPDIYTLVLNQMDNKTYAGRPAQTGAAQLVYMLDNKVFEDATAEMHDRQVVQFETDEVIEIGFTSADDQVTFRRSGQEWRYQADPVLPIDAQKVTEAIERFRDLRTHRYAAYKIEDPSAYMLHEGVRRVSITLQDGTKMEIVLSSVGPENDPDRSKYARLADIDKVFLLTGEQALAFDKTLEHFENR
ncbi:MAG: DUF4340 domain-containing protein [Phycisphaerales bacterium]|nr:DUF4340 domain-containing protein [Phycisphaerales bacterium]